MTRFALSLLTSSFLASVHAQESAALFDAPLVTLGEHDRFGFLTDFDQDGFQDAVSWWWTNPDADEVSVRGHRNDGTGKLVLRWARIVQVDPVTSGGSFRIFPCQLDSDGLTDISLVYQSASAATVRVLRSRGTLTPELADDYSVTWTGTASYPELHAVVADFSGDGLADLAYSLEGNLKLMEYVPGQSGLVLRSSTFPFGSDFNVVQGLLMTDADGDATPDLLAWRGSALQLLSIQGCQVAATQAFTQGITDHHMPASGDIDNDGDEDIVVWDMARYVVLRRTGAASWSIEPPVGGGPAEYLVDVDQDGDLDGVCCGGGGDPETPDNKLTSTFRIAVNDGSGRFAPSLDTPWLGSDHLAGITDLDHDGDLDVVAGRCVLYARGSLTERGLLGSPQTERQSADIDGDADPDFGIGLRPMKRNLGDGRTVSYSATYPVAPPGTSWAGYGWPGDFDGDGDADFVVRHQSGATFLSHRLLTNQGGGAFVDAGPAGPSGVDFNPDLATGNQPDLSLAVDADGDGDLDLLTRASFGIATRSLLWWNDGAGYFTAGPAFPDENVLWIGDLTGDGLPDIVGTWSAYSGASYGYWGWHEGLGGGAFRARVQLGPRAGNRLAVADLDSDGDLDLATAFLFDVYLFWNDGSGVFTSERLTQLGLSNADSFHKLWSTDVDVDGRPDLLVSGSELEPNGVALLLRRADNSGWRAPVTHIFSGPYPDGMLCDVDGDGDEDFVTDRWMRNATHALPRSGQRRQVGAGTRGTGWLFPTLGAAGPFRPGETAELRVRGGLGGARAVLTVTLVRGGQRGPGGWVAPTFDQVLARVPFVLDGPSGEAGAGSWTRSYAVAPSFAGDTRRYSVEIEDPAAAGGLARTNDLVISYGP